MARPTDQDIERLILDIFVNRKFGAGEQLPEAWLDEGLGSLPFPVSRRVGDGMSRLVKKGLLEQRAEHGAWALTEDGEKVAYGDTEDSDPRITTFTSLTETVSHFIGVAWEHSFFAIAKELRGAVTLPGLVPDDDLLNALHSQWYSIFRRGLAGLDNTTFPRAVEDLVILLRSLESVGKRTVQSIESVPKGDRTFIREKYESLRAETTQFFKDFETFLPEIGFHPHTFDRLPDFASIAERAAQQAEKGATMANLDPRRVFVIYGRNGPAYDAMCVFLRALGLDPLGFDEVRAKCGGSPFVGDVVKAGIAQAHGIIAMFTPDEWAELRPKHRYENDKPEEVHRWQSRPNVIFEAGLALGIAEERTILVTLGGDVSLFSDAAGRHIVRLDNSPAKKNLLRNTLDAIKCTVDFKTSEHLDKNRGGDFEGCVKKPEGEPAPQTPFTEEKKPDPR